MADPMSNISSLLPSLSNKSLLQYPAGMHEQPAAAIPALTAARKFPDNDCDRALGSLLLICGLIGVPANAFSCYSFYNIEMSKNRNSIYFRGLYMLISLVDCFIGLGQIPVIENLMLGRQGSLLSIPAFSTFWIIFWRSFVLTSVFLVAQLSVSRLIVIVKPHHYIPFPYIWAPVVFCVGVVAGLGMSIATNYVNVTFFPSSMAMSSLLGGKFDYNAAYISRLPIPAHVIDVDVIVRCLVSMSLGVFFFPVLISFIMSLIMLNKAKCNALKANASSRKHAFATNTIIIVTMVYLVCNIPTVAFLFIRLYRMIQVSRVEIDIDLAERQKITNPTYMEKFYLKFIVEVMFVAINSALNPFIYMWRIKKFRKFVFVGARKSQSFILETTKKNLVFHNISRDQLDVDC